MSDELPRILVNATAQIEKQKSPPPSGLKVKLVPAKYLKRLNEEAKKQLAISVKALEGTIKVTSSSGLIHEEKTEVAFFAAMVSNSKNISMAVDKIIDNLNVAANRGFIKGALARMSSMELPNGKTVVFCYPSMTVPGVRFFKGDPLIAKMGSLPIEIE